MPPRIPTDYRENHPQAKARFGSLADDYLHHTIIGDPLADAVVEALSEFPKGERQRILKCALDGPLDRIQNAPQSMIQFMEAMDKEPDWMDHDAMREGCRTFHRNSEMFLTAFVTSILIEGFCTYISKSFVITGRLVDQGVKRLRQNNRHLMEIFLPGGMDRQGDGWKLSVRIRLVHAQVRRLLAKSPDWDSEAWGTPISAAHMIFAASVFSALLLKRASQLGVRPSDRERHGFMQVWRYSSYLMGVPETHLPEDEARALRIYEVGWACEPPIGLDSRILAHGLIQSAPVIIGKDNPRDRRALAHYVFRVSRAMIGNKLADKLRYPKSNVTGLLLLFQWKNLVDRCARRFIPGWKRKKLVGQFSALIEGSYYHKDGLNYNLPSSVHAEDDRTF